MIKIKIDKDVNNLYGSDSHSFYCVAEDGLPITDFIKNIDIVGRRTSIKFRVK